MRRCSLAAIVLFLMPDLSSAQLAESRGATVFALSDVDMVPTVYETGELGAPDPHNRDALSIITSPTERSRSVAMTEVSNSTYGPPGALDVSLDGQFVFVAETLRQRSERATRLDELQQGDTIRSLQFDGGHSAVVDSVRIGIQPQAIHLNPAGDLIAAITADAKHELTFVPVREGRFGQASSFGLGLEPSTGFIPLKATWVQWHPSGRYVGVNLVDRG
ncbi:MAG: hypothetical protein E5X61_29585, partial [Mesorhizobium sp.]